MNLDFTPEENAFRDEVRTFIRDNYPAELRKAQDENRPLTKDEYLLWHKVLAKKGWVAPSWPKDLGGTDWTPTQKYIWSEETARADCLRPAAVRPVDAGAGALHLRHRRAEEEVPARHLQRQDLVVSGLLRAGRRLRPGQPEDQGRADHRRRRQGILHRQRPEDLDDAGPARRLGLLPGPHRSELQAAGRHLLPADRHEDAGHLGASDHHPGGRARGQRRVPRQCEGAGREPHLPREPGLDLRQGAAGARTLRHRRRGALQAQPGKAAHHRRDRASATPAPPCWPTPSSAARWPNWRST